MNMDSIIFVSHPDIPDPPTGNFLGDLVSELKPDQHIVEFVSLGAKSYAYVQNDGKTCVKVKGFTLNGKTLEVINMSSMLDMLFQDKSVNVSYTNLLQRDKKLLQIKQYDMIKHFRVTYDKRRIVDKEYNTLPRGYTLR